MAERKSKPKHTPRERDDEEPEGFEKLKQNPLFILIVVIVVIVAAVFGIIRLAAWLSGN
ncbi:MAG: hypothetical protein KY455_01180 [Euryarchaeota archaeon]|nr:hypothetical protein [Euryarchaeota archaeon]